MWYKSVTKATCCDFISVHNLFPIHIYIFFFRLCVKKNCCVCFPFHFVTTHNSLSWSSLIYFSRFQFLSDHHARLNACARVLDEMSWVHFLFFSFLYIITMKWNKSSCAHATCLFYYCTRRKLFPLSSSVSVWLCYCCMKLQDTILMTCSLR